MNTALERLLDSITATREALDDVRREQNGDSDESNEEYITAAHAALDALEGAATDIVP